MTTCKLQSSSLTFRNDDLYPDSVSHTIRHQFIYAMRLHCHVNKSINTNTTSNYLDETTKAVCSRPAVIIIRMVRSYYATRYYPL